MSDALKTKVLQLAQAKKTTRSVSAETTDFVELPDHLRYDEPNDYKFLRDYVQFSSRWSPRSPVASHEAVALHILSAAAAGRVVYDYGGRNRASLYQFLVAPSTLFAKTTVANIGADLLKESGLLRVVIGRATPQSFFDQCLEKVPDDYDSMTIEEQTRVRERLQNAAQRAWTADEFGAWATSMLREGSVSYEFRSLLLQIYDSPDEVYMSTRTYGTSPLRNPTLSLFALSTYTDLYKLAGPNSTFWRDGLLARFDWITTADGEQHTNDQFPKGQRQFPTHMVETLRTYDAMLGRASVSVTPVREQLNNGKEKTLRNDVIVQRCPEFVVSIDSDVYEAVGAYDNWLRDTIADGLVVDLQPNYGRIADRCLRIACLLASSESRPVCTMRDWTKALAIVERRRRCLHWIYDRLTSGSQEQERVAKTDAILRYITTERCVSLRDIQQKFRRQYPTGVAELQRELDTLVAAGELHPAKLTRNRVFYAVDAAELPSGVSTGTGTE